MSKTIEANINPAILVWARKEQGYDIQIVKQKFKKLELWEKGEKKPSMSQIRLLAHYYKRPSAIFFLTEPPESETNFVDFRVVAHDPNKQLSPETKTEIRVCESRRKKALELGDLLGEVCDFELPTLSLTDDIEDSVMLIREKLGVRQEEIDSIRNDKDALIYWIQKLEQANILVFKSITNTGWRASYKEIRGSSAYYPEYPWMLINSQEHERGQLFTLGHELAHILLQGNSICDLDERNEDASLSGVEKFCNQFSASLHIPKTIFEAFAQKNRLQFATENQLNSAIEFMKKTFHISPEASARRLLTLGYATKEYYQEMRQQQMDELEKERQKSGGGGDGTFYYKRVIQWNGIKYTHLVLEGYHQDYISLGEVAHSLRTKVQHIESIERELYR